MPQLAQIEQSSATRQVCPFSRREAFCSLYKTNKFQVAVRLFRNRSQKTSKCGTNISDTLVSGSCGTFLFVPHFDVICDLLLNRRMATWNPYVNYAHHRSLSFLCRVPAVYGTCCRQRPSDFIAAKCE